MTVETPFQDPSGGSGDPDNLGDRLTNQTFWTVEDTGGEMWQLGIYDLDSAGREILVAAIPLTPTDTVELDEALNEAHQSMTGEPLTLPESDAAPFSWRDRSSWPSHAPFRVVVAVVIGLLVAVALVINIVEQL